MTQTLERSPSLSDVDIGPLNESLGFLLRLAQIRSFDAFFEELKGSGLRPGDYSVLILILQNPGIRQGLLARKLMIKPAQMTKVIRAFENSGYVKRHIPDNDRRAVKLTLTLAGKEFTIRHLSKLDALESNWAKRLHPTQHKDLIKLLREFVGLEESNQK